MEKSARRILYIELGTAHTEIIASFVKTLVPEFEIQLLIHEKSIPRVAQLQALIKIIPLKEESYLKDVCSAKSTFKPDFVLLNSAQGRKVRNLCLRFLFDRTPFVGIHHNAENILSSFTQKIIHLKIKKYIVLADFIRDFLKTSKLNNFLKNSKIKVESFYPLLFDFPHPNKFAESDLTIAIPGVLEQDRRDYRGLVELVKSIHAVIDPKWKFVLLGNGKSHNGPEIVALIKNYGIESRFICFDHYVEDDILLKYIQNCRAIMPLLHPGTRWFHKYFESKISGAYSLAFAFAKPLLMHKSFSKKTEFAAHGIYYDLEVGKNGEVKSKMLPQLLRELSNETYPKPKHLTKFDFAVQKEKLIGYIGS